MESGERISCAIAFHSPSRHQSFATSLLLSAKTLRIISNSLHKGFPSHLYFHRTHENPVHYLNHLRGIF